jgi:uncharacterized membrane protein YbaN (DUF454 family)
LQIGIFETIGETCALNTGRLYVDIKRKEAFFMSAPSGKAGYRVLAYVSVGLAVAGVVLPLLPTTPFVLLAAYFASKGSPAFARWLEEHPHFGPAIANWRERRAIPAKAKGLACGMMILSWSLLFLLGASTLVLTVSGLFLSCTACYLLTRASC